jgi:putative ABC transport system permease protein
VGALREKVLDIDKDLPLVRIATGEELFLDSLSRPRFAAWLLGSFALLAVFIAVIGVYGVVSYSTASRVNEIGIRMAIGAPQQSILRLILSESVRLSLWGILFGVVLSLVAERAFASVWDRTGGIPVYLSTALLLGAIAFIASLIPALRATRVDPNAALRYE